MPFIGIKMLSEDMLSKKVQCWLTSKFCQRISKGVSGAFPLTRLQMSDSLRILQRQVLESPKIEENDSKMMSCVKNGKNKKGKDVKQKMSSSKMKKRKNGRKNDGCRNCKKTFRCNLEEAWKLEHWAQKNHMTESEIIRRKVFKGEMSGAYDKILSLLEELEEQIRRIGVNINQIARNCNSKKYVGDWDYMKLVNELNLLDGKIDEISRRIKGELHGDHEAAAHENSGTWK